METIDADTMKALRDGLRGPGEIPAALDLLDYLDNCDSCGVANPERVSFDRLDRFGEEA